MISSLTKMCLGDFWIRLFRMVMSCRDMRVRGGIGAGPSEPSFFLRFQALNVQLEEDPEQTQNTLERLLLCIPVKYSCVIHKS